MNNLLIKNGAEGILVVRIDVCRRLG